MRQVPVIGYAELVVSAGCAVAAARAAVVRGGTWRLSWLWLAVGVSAWVVDRAAWILDAAVDGHPTERPAPVDAGLLLLAVCGAVGMVLHPVARAGRSDHRLRLAIDVATITTSLLLLIWQLPAGTHLDAAPTTVEQLAQVICPVANALMTAVLLTLLIYRMSYSTRGTRWLCAGLLMISGAGTLTGYRLTFGSGPLASAAYALWLAGFAAITVATVREPRTGHPDPPPGSPPRQALPYLLIAGIYLLMIWRWTSGHRIEVMQVILLGLLGLLAYGRQHLLTHGNERLLEQLDDGREQLRRSEMLDQLTGLPNRAGLADLFAEATSASPRRAVTVLCLRPNRPHLLDGIGPDDGDAAVRELADRIAGCLRPGDQLTRITESTFAVLIADGEAPATELAREVMLAVEAPVHTPNRRLHLSLAAGIADGCDPGAVQQAMIALHTVSEVPAGIAVFTDQMLQDHAARLDLGQAVARSLRSAPATSVRVLFEPVVDLASGQLAGLAARAEWSDGDHAPVPAGQLVALAREAGLAARVDAVVLDAALTSFGEWAGRWPATCRQLWIAVCLETLAEP
jgi:GGDEF domain-containing protein